MLQSAVYGFRTILCYRTCPTGAGGVERVLAGLDGASKTAILKSIAAAIRNNNAKLIEANSKDLAAAKENNLGGGLVERLKLDESA